MCSIPRSANPPISLYSLGNSDLLKLERSSLHSRRGEAVLSSGVRICCPKMACWVHTKSKPHPSSGCGQPCMVGCHCPTIHGQVAEARPFSDSSWINCVRKLRSSTCLITQPWHPTYQYPHLPQRLSKLGHWKLLIPQVPLAQSWGSPANWLCRIKCMCSVPLEKWQQTKGPHTLPEGPAPELQSLQVEIIACPYSLPAKANTMS
jgi:hypothetical protein